MGDGAAVVSVSRGTPMKENRRPASPCPVRPAGSSINPEGRTRAEGLYSAMFLATACMSRKIDESRIRA